MDIFRKLGRGIERAKRGATDGDEDEYRCRDCDERYAAPREDCLECGGEVVAASRE